MVIIGLCGGSGAGKTAASAAMASLGAAVINTDEVYREITYPGSPCVRDIADAVRRSVVNDDGSLNRAALAALVFSDDEARSRLNSVAHRHIKKATEALLERYRNDGYPAAIVDAPLLFESGFDKMCDVTVCVVANQDARIARIMKRDGISEAQAAARIGSQYDDAELRCLCDYTIENDGTPEELMSAAKEIYNEIIEKRQRT
jgi:dephospho-CoA kinase